MSDEPRRVAVIGSGYVGTVVAACLAHIGHQVVGVESDSSKLESLHAGRAPFREAGLDRLISSGAGLGRLSFTRDIGEAMAESDLVFICVGTPPREDGTPDMTAMTAVAHQLAPHLEDRHILVNKSTVPVGSGRWLASTVEEAVGNELSGGSPAVVSNPEFLREGQAVNDYLHPDRVVLGADDPSVIDELVALYHPILEQSFEGCPPGRCRVPLVRTDLVTAELSKYASNAFLATKVSFANEIARLCENVGADVDDVVAAMGLDRRIGRDFLGAGLGWGGSCFGKDVAALIATGKEHGCPPRILKATAEVNAEQRRLVVDYLEDALAPLAGRRVGLLGLAFKANTDDLRDSPAVDIARCLLEREVRVTAFDPAVPWVPGCEELRLASDPYKAAADADAVVLATDWLEFRELDLGLLASSMRGRIFFDGRNMVDPTEATKAGLAYRGIGRRAGELSGAGPVSANKGEIRGDVASGAARRRTVLVTGGAGFVGSHLCESLVGRGDEVICLDNLCTGEEANIAALAGVEGFHFWRHDVSSALDGFDAFCEGRGIGGIDLVFHLASPASPADYLHLPLETLAAGSAGTTNMLELAVDHGARFVLASTSEVYGDPLSHPQHEEYWGNVNPVGPRSVYDEAKRYAEAVTMAYHRSRGLDVAVARIFNTYGPRLRPADGRVVSNFIVRALAGDPITLYGDGSQTRSFCYVDDLVAGLIALAEAKTVGPVNLGNPHECTVRELAALVLELTGSSSPVVTAPLPADDPTRRRPDITRARTLLGWEPSVPLAEGLTRTIAAMAGGQTADGEPAADLTSCPR